MGVRGRYEQELPYTLDRVVEEFGGETGDLPFRGRDVGLGFLLGEAERERFRMLMRMYEKFTGCRVLSYCLMSNHFHIFLEVTPVPEGGISDAVL